MSQNILFRQSDEAKIVRKLLKREKFMSFEQFSTLKVAQTQKIHYLCGTNAGVRTTSPLMLYIAPKTK